MDIDKKIIERVNYALNLAQKALNTKSGPSSIPYSYIKVGSSEYAEFVAFSKSFILSVFSSEHSYYTTFDNIINSANKNSASSVEEGIGLLSSIKSEIEYGWITSLKQLVSAEIFSNFLEMAEHLLLESYKDAAAVMVGSVLEEHLRVLCKKNCIEITENKNGRDLPKKADFLNSELSKALIYNKLDQKSITAWLDLRNKAAHGNYLEYNSEQVTNMLSGVTEFIGRTS